MVPALRKRHRRIWLVLAVIMPLLFVATMLVIPRPAYQDELYQTVEKKAQEQPASPDNSKEQDQ